MGNPSEGARQGLGLESNTSSAIAAPVRRFWFGRRAPEWLCQGLQSVVGSSSQPHFVHGPSCRGPPPAGGFYPLTT